MTAGARQDRREALLFALAGLLALAAAMGIGRFALTPILPVMALSPQEAGVLAGANFAGYAVGALLAGYLSFSLSPRQLFLAALGVSAATTFMMALPAPFAVLCVIRFFGGVASAGVLVNASAVILSRVSAHHPGLVSLHFAGVGTGIAFSALFIGWRIEAGAGDGELWLLSGAASLVLLFGCWRLLPATPGEAVAAADVSASSLKKTGRLYPAVIAYGLFGFGYIITATFLAVIIRENPTMDGWENIAWFVVGITAAPSIAFWSAVSKRIGPAGALALAFVVEAVGVASSVLADGIAAALISAAFLGGTFMGITALGLQYAREKSRLSTPKTLGIMTASFGTGQFAGPLFAGTLAAATGSYSLPSLIASAALLAGAALILADHFSGRFSGAPGNAR